MSADPAVVTVGVTFPEVLAALRHRRWWIVSTTLVAAAASVCVLLLSTPVYRATAVLVPVADQRAVGGVAGALDGLGGLASLAGLSFSSGSAATEEALAVLRSRAFLQKFIADRNLLPVIFHEQWDTSQERWRLELSRQPTLAKAHEQFASKVLSVTHDKKTGLITISVTWRDRNIAARWANELADQINGEMRARAIVQADGYRSYLERELAAAQYVETRDAINRLIEAQIKDRMLATVNRDFAFRVVDRALAPDADRPLWPRKALLLVGGPILGLLASMFVVVWGCVLRAERRRE